MSLSFALLREESLDQGAVTASLQQSPALGRAVHLGTSLACWSSRLAVLGAGWLVWSPPGWEACAQGAGGRGCHVLLCLGPAAVGINPERSRRGCSYLDCSIPSLPASGAFPQVLNVHPSCGTSDN